MTIVMYFYERLLRLSTITVTDTIKILSIITFYSGLISVISYFVLLSLSINLFQILSEQKANHSVAIHEFDVECELLARLNHPNVASILGGGIIPR